MTKFVQRVAFLSLVGLSLLTGAAHAQKIGVVDLQAVLTGMPEVQAANQKLDATRQLWVDTLKNMQTQYQAKLDAYSKVGETGSADFKKKAQEDLTSLQDQFNKYQQAKLNPETGELAQMQQQLLKPIYEKLQTNLGAFAKKEKLAVIIQKTSTLYSEESVDVTSKFQEYLKAQGKM